MVGIIGYYYDYSLVLNRAPVHTPTNCDVVDYAVVQNKTGPVTYHGYGRSKTGPRYREQKGKSKKKYFRRQKL